MKQAAIQAYLPFTVKLLVDAFFIWCHDSLGKIAPSSETAKGIKYCINQEKYLCVFLDDPQIPLDNNLAEQAIRLFCIGKKNWKLIDTVSVSYTHLCDMYKQTTGYICNNL